MLIDSNLIIYAASGNYPDLVNWFLEKELFISTVSLVETLGYHKLNPKEKSALNTIFSGLTCLYPSSDVF